jgi:3D (Asp-Asp-Asp) domain-containing protein
MQACKTDEKFVWKSLDVKVSAYNSVPEQTDNEPFIGAWGDSLSNRQKSIAISRDLIPLGLKHNTRVMIEGLPGVYLVKDKMAARWKKRIDIYMGDKVEKAKKWGVKDLSIVYAVAKDSITLETEK